MFILEVIVLLCLAPLDYTLSLLIPQPLHNYPGHAEIPGLFTAALARLHNTEGVGDGGVLLTTVVCCVFFRWPVSWA